MSTIVKNQTNLTKLTNKITEIFKPASRVVISEKAIKYYLDPKNNLNEDELEILASRLYRHITSNMWYAKDLIDYVRDNVVKNPIMFVKTRDCEFSSRIKRLFSIYGCKHIIDVISKSEDELLHYRSLGPSALAEIKKFLEEAGLMLLKQKECKHLAECGISNISVLMCCTPEDLVQAGVNKSLIRRLVKYSFINPPITKSLLDVIKDDERQKDEVINIKGLPNTAKGFKVKKLGDKIANSLKDRSYNNSDRLILQAINANYIAGLDDINTNIKYTAGVDSCPKILNEQDWLELVEVDMELLKYTPNRVIYGNRDKVLESVMNSNYSMEDKLKRIGKVQTICRTEERRKKLEEESTIKQV